MRLSTGIPGVPELPVSSDSPLLTVFRFFRGFPIGGLDINRPKVRAQLLDDYDAAPDGSGSATSPSRGGGRAAEPSPGVTEMVADGLQSLLGVGSTTSNLHPAATEPYKYDTGSRKS